MAEAYRREIVQRIIRNLLDIQILRLIKREPMWGYQVKKQVESKFGIRVRHGALYPLLSSMEEKSLVSSEKSLYGRRVRKVYSITVKGEEYLHAYDSVLQEQIKY